MSKLSRKKASIIFKARTRMLDIKDNFRNKHRTDICRKCGTEKETQKHVLEDCPDIHTGEDTKVSKDDIFTDNTDKLRQTADKIEKIIQTLVNSAAPHNRGELPS